MEQRLRVEGEGSACLHIGKEVVEVVVERTDDGIGLYKAWLWGGKGKQVLVGTLVPESAVLKRKRRFSIEELKFNRCWPVEGCRIVLSFPFENRKWYCEQEPEKLISDPVLKGQIKGSMMCSKKGDRTWLAAPFQKEHLVMLNAAFCLGRVEAIHGSPYIIWEFDGVGRLRFP